MSREQERGAVGASGTEGPVRLRAAVGPGQSPDFATTSETALATALASAAADHQPRVAQLDDLRRALGSALGPAGLSTPPAPRPSRLRLGRFGWRGGIAVAMLAIAGGALWFGRGGQTVAPPPIARPGNPPLPVPTPPATEAAPASAASEPTAPGRRKEPESHTAQRQDEVRLVSRAQRALGNNPALAFSLAERHRALFPGGALAQEREVIAVEALRALRRPAEAQARARRFRARYPDSAHLPRVEGQRL